MKLNNQLRVCVLAILCVGLPVALRATDDSTIKSDNAAAGVAPQTSTPYTTTATAGSVNANNKASSLIGMEVRNSTDEKLGHIKDLVLDFQSGKVSYAVLDGGSVFKSKLFAIPLSAFSTGPDSRYLILNADKSKMEMAQGFDKNSWPSVNNPDWGATTQFWQDNSQNSIHNTWTPDNTKNSTDKLNQENAPTASPSTPNQ